MLDEMVVLKSKTSLQFLTIKRIWALRKVASKDVTFLD